MSAPKVMKSRLPASLDANVSEQDTAGRNQKSARKLHGSFPKGDVRHWLSRVKREDSADYGIQISYRGERRRFPLKTSNKEAAARKALGIYQGLVANGWETVLAEHKPETLKPVHPASVGELIAEVQATAGFRPVTLNAYSQCLRQIVAEIADIGDQPKLDEQGKPKKDRRGRIVYMSRRDHLAGGRDAWLAKVDAQCLDVLTVDAVRRWMIAYSARAGDAPDARRRAENTASSLIRNARSLFSEKALHFVKSKLTLPEPLPFAGVKLPKKGNSRYQSKIDAAELIAAANVELEGAPFQVFALGLMCGFRKKEIDLLEWDQVDFTASQIRLDRTAYFEPKNEDSIGTVDVEPELLALLRGWKAKATGPFVIESKSPPKANGKTYRCETSFKALYAWLRGKGITAQKPLHELRKEVGAVLASTQGIFVAQSVLRHAQISTTAAYYADKKRTITAGLGALLTAPAPNVTAADFTGTKADAGAKQGRRRA